MNIYKKLALILIEDWTAKKAKGLFRRFMESEKVADALELLFWLQLVVWLSYFLGVATVVNAL